MQQKASSKQPGSTLQRDRATTSQDVSKNPGESTLKVKMTKSQHGGAISSEGKTRQSENLQMSEEAGARASRTQATGPNAMGPPVKSAASGELARKPKRKTIV